MIANQTPDQFYKELFELVQSRHLFSDSKTFVDAVPKAAPNKILNMYRRQAQSPEFDLGHFVRENFAIPEPDDTEPTPAGEVPVGQRIEQLWDLLTRAADEKEQHSSLIPLPRPYVVPGGRFREVYYWDSYFTMLGLADSGRTRLIEDMVENFAYLVREIGFIPNGNRTYYCSRSQPPYFALMVELLANVKKDETVFGRYLPQMIREYDFWMAGIDVLDGVNSAYRRVIGVADGYLNRYWDDAKIPRQESFAEDVEAAGSGNRDAADLYRDIRAACESGWDFSTRWFEDQHSKASICTTRIIPVDLNALMFNLEAMLARTCATTGDEALAQFYRERSETRKGLIQTLFFDEDAGFFVDQSLPDLKPTGTHSLAAAYPLYFGIATPEQGEKVAKRIHAEFLRAGGWLTTLADSGQQWDFPNGWAPLQWTTYKGLKRYGYHDEAEAGARNWVENNLSVYRNTGRLLEKYNVEKPGTAGVGGEYMVQDGFGWTNAILLRLMRALRVEE